MKPDYEKYRGNRTDPKDLVAARIPVVLKTQIEAIASVEGDSVSGLILEGMARVIEDRRNDPDYVNSAQTALQNRIATLQDELGQTQNMLQAFSPSE